MNPLRTIPLVLLILSAVAILFRPAYGEFGLVLFYVSPLLFGLAACRIPLGIVRQALLTFVVVGVLGAANVVFQGLAEGSFYFDGEADLVWFGVGVQLVNAMIAFEIGWVIKIFASRRTKSATAE